MYTFFWRAQIVNVSKLLSQCVSSEANSASSSVQAARTIFDPELSCIIFSRIGRNFSPDNENGPAVGIIYRWVYLEAGCKRG